MQQKKLWVGLALSFLILYPLSYSAVPTVKTYYDAALKAESANKSDEAYKQFQNALKMAEKNKDPNLSIILDAIAKYHLKRKQYPESEAYFKKAHILVKNKNFNRSGDILFNLGLIAHIQGKKSQAEIYYQQALADYKKAKPLNKQGIDNISKNLVILKENRFPVSQEAQKAYENAVQAFKAGNYDEANALSAKVQTLLGPEHPSSAHAISIQGQIAFNNRQFDVSESLMKKAVAILEKSVGKENPGLSAMLMTLGNVFRTQARVADASSAFSRALDIQRKAKQPNEDEIKKLESLLSEVKGMDFSDNYLHELPKEVKRWRDGQGTINIFFVSGDGIPGWKTHYLETVKSAFLEWQRVMAGQFQFAFVSDPSEADVNIRWFDKPMLSKTLDKYTEQHTMGRKSDETRQNFLRVADIEISLFDEHGKPIQEAILNSIALHEIGHLLGINGHSSNTGDIMYAASSQTAISSRDIQTLKLIYQKPADITNPNGIRLAQYRNFTEYVDKAIVPFNQLEYRIAYDYFKQAQTLYQGDDYVNYLTGITAYNLFNDVDAIQYCEKAVARPSTYQADAYDCVASALVRSAENEKADGRKERALREERLAKAKEYFMLALQSSTLSELKRASIHSHLDWIENQKKRKDYGNRDSLIIFQP